MASKSALFVALGLISASIVTTRRNTAGSRPVGAEAFLSQLPVSFEPNRGQAAMDVRFLARTLQYTVLLDSDGITMEPAARHCSRPPRLVFAGKRNASVPVGSSKLQARSNYYAGADPSAWLTGIPNYERVQYTGIYRGIDLVLRGQGGELEYDWIVAPHSDPREIEIRFKEADALRLTEGGDLVATTACGEIRQRLPVAYQESPGGRRAVPVSYSIRTGDTVALSVGPYDQATPLVIDPSISIAVLLGSSSGSLNYDFGAAIAAGADGSIYVTGPAGAADFPVTAGASVVGTPFVLRLNASGTALIYSTRIAGLFGGSAITVDQAGNAYITGATNGGIPVTPNAYQPKLAGFEDAFLVKLDPSGALLYASYFGGMYGDGGNAIVLDGSGNIVLAGGTGSPDFPTTPGAFQRTCSHCDVAGDGFAAKFSNDGKTLLASTLLGGGAADSGFGAAADAAGNVYVTGVTSSTDFPTTPGAFQSTFRSTFPGAPRSAFITKLNSALSALVYSTFLGGSGSDYASAIAVDSSGSASVTGLTNSADFPTANALQPVLPSTGNPPNSNFVTKLSSDGSRLVYSTFIGAGEGGGIAVDPSGNAYITGVTFNTSFPQVNPLQTQINGGPCLFPLAGCSDAFVAKILPDGSALGYSTFFGGSNTEYGRAIAVDSQGNAYVTGQWNSGLSQFPATALSNLSKGRGAFILKLSPTGSTPLVPSQGVTNGASFKAGLPASGIATVFGQHMVDSPGIVTASSLPLPTQINGVSVTYGGVPLPLFAIANVNGQEQVNFQVPASAPATPKFQVVNNGKPSMPVVGSLPAIQPGVFTTDGTTGAIQHGLTYQQVTSANPAKRGEVLIIYATGLGAVTPDPGLGNPAPSSPPAVTTTTPTVTIGGAAAQVMFSGLTPGFVALNQVNVQVPQGAPSGNVDVVLTSGGVSSPPVKLAVDSSPAPARSSNLRSRR